MSNQIAVVALALSAALAYGLSDFLGGVVSRRGSAWAVAAMASIGALAASAVLWLAVPGHPTAVQWLWGGVAGLGGGFGSGFLYRGLASGRMGVVAPVSAVGSAVVPVLAGLAGGERPSALVWLGIAIAAPGIWLVAREPSLAGEAPSSSGLTDGIAAGAGFGLLFAAMGQVPHAAGFGPLVLAQAISVVAILLIARSFGQSALPSRRLEIWGVVPGVIATIAVWCFLVASQRGLLSVASVLTALYPASTVLLAVLVLRERVHRTQSIGLALCAMTVVCVATG